MPTPTKPPMGIDAHLQAVMDHGANLLKSGQSAQTRGTVTGPPVQNTGMPTTTPPATPTAATNQHWWSPLLNSLMSIFGGAPAAKSFSTGAAYLKDGGKQRTADTNKVIDEASK